MAVVENRFVCDLAKPVQAQALKGNVFSLDNLGSRISVLIYENGQPATISGSVTANCILPDGSTVNVNGSLTTENGVSKAYVDVPQSCLLIPGILKIAIKCTSSSIITTLAAIVANVYMTKTDNVITPSQQIIADWNAEISAAIATQNAAIANQDTKINDLKSALDKVGYEKIISIPNGYARLGYGLNSAGRYAADSKYAGGYALTTTPVLYVLKGSTIKANSGYKATVALWDHLPITTTQSTTYRTDFVDITSGNTYTFQHDGYLAYAVAYSDNSDIPSGKTADVFVNEGLTVNLLLRTAIDVALSAEGNVTKLENKAAKDNIPLFVLNPFVQIPKNVLKNTNYTSGYYIKPDGSLVANATYKTSDYFLIEPNTQYITGNNDGTIVFYDIDKIYISGRDIGINTVVTSPINAAYARYSTNAIVSTWNISKGNVVLSDEHYFEPYFDRGGYVNSPYWKGEFIISKPDVFPWYECECLKENYNAFDFALGTDSAFTGTQYADVISKYDALMNSAESGYITKTSIGSGSGTDQNGNSYTLYEYAFVPRAYSSANAPKTHPKILIDCSIHGFEKNSTFGIFSLMYDVVNNWEKNPVLATLRNFVEIRIVPVADPYGFDRNVRSNANGVNLNRNFPAFDWTYEASGINKSGEAPLDQPEAAALAAWMQANSDMWIYLNTHTNGHYYADGYSEANALMPYSDIDDPYYRKLYSAFKRHIERQTAYLPKEFSSLVPTRTQYIGKIQDMATSGSGYADQYVCWYLKMALAFTLEGCNYLRMTTESTITYSTGAIKLNAEMFGNTIAQLLYEYLD